MEKFNDYIGFGTPSKEVLSHYLKLGHVISILKKTRSSSNQEIILRIKEIDRTLLHQNVKFFFNDLGNPICYLVYSAGPDRPSKLLSQGLRPFGKVDVVQKWNENRWLIDAVCLPGYMRFVAKKMRQESISGGSNYFYYSRKNEIKTVKLNITNDQT